VIPTHSVEGPDRAPVVVLISSLGTTGELWEPQVPALRRRFRVVRPEHRGHGGSTAPAGPYAIADLGRDLVELLDHLQVERASLCGVSLGGMVAMWVAAHHPDRVERLVLACTAPALPPASAWQERAALVRAEGVAGLLPTLLERWFADPERAPVELVSSMLAATDAEGYAACCEALAGMDLRADLAAITAPTLVIAGAADPVVPPRLAVELQEAIGGAGLVVLAGAAHLANLDRPEGFTDAVVRHLWGDAATRGSDVRREVLGADHVGRSADRDPDFVDLITRYAWGEIWTRPGLDRATRSCITIAMLVAQSRWEELPLHLHGALRNGLTREQVTEVLLQAAIYCGVPAANTAFTIAERELR
jgi:3-oxoadipate enol-lactonase/4-carboxymuconolactone decarboxylase